MSSKWSQYKNEVLKLRKQGKTFNQIIEKFNIPKSTLSYWFKDIELTDSQKSTIKRAWLKAIKGSRANAVKWHNQQKESRLLLAKAEAEAVLAEISSEDNIALELSLAFLYLGEGAKKSNMTSLGNSNPEILKFYLYCLNRLYGVSYDKLRIVLHLRADQDAGEMKQFWSKVLAIPSSAIKSVYLDKRTLGRPTYGEYKGVCVIEGGSVAIQRRLLWISKLFYEKMAISRG